jgi:hypothetical protein
MTFTASASTGVVGQPLSGKLGSSSYVYIPSEEFTLRQLMFIQRLITICLFVDYNEQDLVDIMY